MKTTNDRDTFVSEIREHVSNAGHTSPRPKHMKRMRTGIKISPIGLILLCSMVAIGMLTGLLYTMFTVNITGDVQLNGTQHPLFSFDNIEFDTPCLNLTADLTELNSGETKTFSHWIINEDAGAWIVDVNLSQCQWFYNDPPHEFYGLNVTTGNWKLDGVTNTDHIVSPGENISFDIIWSLHHEFVTAADPFPSNISITLNRINEAPTAVDDNAGVIEHNAHGTLDATANDFDLENDELTIISVNNPTPASFVVTINPDNTLDIWNVYGIVGSQPFTFTYTISDGHSNEATATVTFTAHWSG